MNTVSITIRPRGGTDLGSCSPPGLTEFLVRIGEFFSISIEKPNSPGSHIQMAVMTNTRPDNIKRSLLRFYPNFDDNEKKFAIVVKRHSDFDGLVGYTLKECQPWKSNLQHPLSYYTKSYANKSNPHKKLYTFVLENIHILGCEVTSVSVDSPELYNSEEEYVAYLRLMRDVIKKKQSEIKALNWRDKWSHP